MIPVLETKRLILRSFQPGDFEQFADFYGSEASRFVAGPEARTATWRRIASYAGSWFLRGFGKFAVEEKASGRAVGIVGPWYPEGWPEPEIGWTILPEFQRRGYAIEAAVRSITSLMMSLAGRRPCQRSFLTISPRSSWPNASARGATGRSNSSPMACSLCAAIFRRRNSAPTLRGSIDRHLNPNSPTCAPPSTISMRR